MLLILLVLSSLFAAYISSLVNYMSMFCLFLNKVFVSGHWILSSLCILDTDPFVLQMITYIFFQLMSYLFIGC